MEEAVETVLNMNNSEKNNYIAFDIDGTIYDAGNIIEGSFSRAVEKFIEENPALNLLHPSKEDITSTLGLPLEEIFRILFPELDQKGRERLSEICTAELVASIRAREGELIEGADTVIPKLHREGYRMVVASNGVKEYCEAILETYGLIQYFSGPFVYPGDEHLNKTEVVRHYLDELCDVKNMIMIGDRYTDLEAARDNNIPFIGCAFGHAGIEEIKDEKYLVHSFGEIVPVLEGMGL